MAFLDTEREELERLLPGLDAALAARPLEELESPSGPAIGLFRDATRAHITLRWLCGLLVGRTGTGSSGCRASRSNAWATPITSSSEPRYTG